MATKEEIQFLIKQIEAEQGNMSQYAERQAAALAEKVILEGILVETSEQLDTIQQAREDVALEKKRLDGHIKREHDNVRNEKCIQCGKLYFTKEVLRKHVKNIHNKKVNQIEEIVKLFECEFCGKTLRTKQSMQIHVKVVHEGLRDNHVCHICKYLFITVRLNYDFDLN